MFGDLAREIPMYQVTVPWELNRLDEVYATICNHIAKT